MVVRRPTSIPSEEVIGTDPDIYKPGQDITTFPASLSNYQGYPKAGSMGVTFLIDFANVPRAWPLTRLTGMELEVTVRRPKDKAPVILDEEGNPLMDEWDELKLKFEGEL